MASYKQSVGTAVTNYAGNNPGVAEGELWYDSSAYVWKYQYPNVTTTGSWSTQNSLNTARQALAGSGSSTAALAFGGLGGGPTNDPQSVTELWDGSNWTEVNDLNTARGYLAGTGTSTSPGS